MPLCADQFELAEFGGALVSRIDGESDPARQFRECTGTKPSNRGILQAWNQNPKPFMWSATVEEMIKKIDRAQAKMEQIKPGSTQPTGKRRGLVCKLIYGTYHWQSRPPAQSRRQQSSRNAH